MLENFWSNADLKKNFPLALNLGNLIEALTQWFESRGRVICSISVNGMKLKESEEVKFANVKISDIQELRVESHTPEGLLDESLIGCQEHLLRIIDVYEKCAYLFRVQDIPYASRYHELALTGIYHFVDLVNNYAIVYESLRGKLSSAWLKCAQDLPECLTKICSAYEQKDYNLIADILEYELLEILENWKKEISALAELLPEEVSAHLNVSILKDGPSA